MIYNRYAAVAYAQEWAYKRNPRYYNFDTLGGDCTNFISQCLYAGSGIMNYKKTFGWYYNSINDRAPAWTGVSYLYNFLIANKGTGPYAIELPLDKTQVGDIIQLSFDGSVYVHSLIVVAVNDGNIYVATHTDDYSSRALNTYIYNKVRLLHIDGVRG